MKKNHLMKMGFDETSFPQARKTRALREEDAFMEAYSGPDCRACHCIVKVFREGGKAIQRVIRNVIKLKKTSGANIGFDVEK